MAPSEMDVDITEMLCGVAGMACGCESVGCPICEFGLENPEFIVQPNYDSISCAQGVEMLQVMGPMGMCNEAKNIFDDAGCLCKEAKTGITDEVVDEVVDDNTINDTTVEISNATEAPSANETLRDTSDKTSEAGQFFSPLHSATFMLLATFSWFYLI